MKRRPFMYLFKNMNPETHPTRTINELSYLFELNLKVYTQIKMRISDDAYVYYFRKCQLNYVHIESIIFYAIFMILKSVQ